MNGCTGTRLELRDSTPVWLIAAVAGLLSCAAGDAAGQVAPSSSAAIAPTAGTTAPSPYALEGESRFSLRGLIDLRVARGSEAPSWQEGGPGKLRYGGVAGDDGAFERVTRFAIAQLALEPALELPLGWRARAQVNWDGDVDDRGNTSPDHDPVRIVEGYVRRDWPGASGGMGLLVGLSNPPFSLEHVGPARTPLLSLTPSALASWLWEEGRVLGGEGQWWYTAKGAEASAFAGLGWGPDQMGILLARRGWVLSDFLSGANSRLPLGPAEGFTRVFDERDGRPALYAGASVSDPWKLASAHAGYFDNLGNLDVSGVWETRYGVGGVALQPVAGLELTTQFLYGSTTTRGAALASAISAVYAIASYRWREHRLSFRYDDFRVRDEDGGTSTDEDGHAFTVAYLLEIGLRHRVAAEYVWVDSDRTGVSDPGDDGFQVSYRFRY